MSRGSPATVPSPKYFPASEFLGNSLRPVPERAATLERAVVEAHEWVRNIYENGFEPFFADSQWFFPATQNFAEAQRDGYDVHNQVYPYTDRAVIYHMAFIGIKHLGVGQFYLVDLRDSDGVLFDSAATYRMRVPAGVPVSQYWSVTMYDAGTRFHSGQHQILGLLADLWPGHQRRRFRRCLLRAEPAIRTCSELH